MTSPPASRLSIRFAWPSPITRIEQVRLSRPQATAVGAKEPSAKRLYELMFGAFSSVSSRRQASCPARKRSNSSGWSANTGLSSSLRSDRWMWHELPSRSLYFAMNVIAKPSWDAISLAAFL